MASNFNTLQLHAGREPDIASNSRAVPIYSSTSFVFNNSAHASAIMSLQEVGNVCSRIGNPTVAVFETRMAALEGGTAAVAASSGQSAQFVTLSAICSTGDNIVSTSCLYGGTYNQFKVFLKRFGIETKFVEGDNPEDFEKFIDNKTKAIYLESIGSSKWNVPDLPKSHPSHFTATRIIRPNTGYGGVLSFGVQGGLQEASIGSLVVDNLKLASHLANVGDAKTLVIHPSSTTHAQLSSEEQRAAGITADMIRVSVGIEFIDDSIADFAQCFEETGKAIGGSNSKSQGDASNKNGSKVSPKAEHGAGFEI